MKIKRGDAVTLTWDLGMPLTSYTAAKVIIRRADSSTAPIVARAGDIAGSNVTITLSPTESAAPGDYDVEIEMTPGPVTWPSSGYGRLTITPDLG